MVFSRSIILHHRTVQFRCPFSESRRKNTMFSVNSLLVLSLNLPFLAQARWKVGEEVKTTSGLVKGHASKTYPEVSEYLGVRFGQSTGGENRFMPPKRYHGTDKIDASAFVGRYLTILATG
jgi:hypothetical protein